MRSISDVIVAAAGGGKTTRIVKRALEAPSERSALVTYTQNNVGEITDTLYRLNSSIPPQVEIWSWYTFLLRELARPYQSALIQGRVNGIHWSQKRSDRYAKQIDTDRFYFSEEKHIYSDKMAQFICACDKASNGAVIRRLEQRFDRIYIDEVQDLAGYDLDLIEMILRSNIMMTLVGDHRQSTYRTNNSARNSGYAGLKIKKKFEEWRKEGLCGLTYELETHRCNQFIADLADELFPEEPKTISLNTAATGHDGVFAICPEDVGVYVTRYRPQVLRLDVRTDCCGYEAMNFGESKGSTFDRVLIFPHQLGKEWLLSGDFKHVSGSASKLYVGITRARHSVAFVADGEVRVAGISRYLG
jgi:DNA helicase-2/ATP-dependent DNA helicase PcrA